MTTPRADTWHDHLSEKEDVTCEPVVGDTVACQLTTHRAYVTNVAIDVELT